jgi:hypothetical protein
MTNLLLGSDEEEDCLSSNRKQKKPIRRRSSPETASRSARVNLCEVSFSGGVHRSRHSRTKARHLRKLARRHRLKKKRIVESESDSNSDDASDDGAPDNNAPDNNVNLASNVSFLDTKGRACPKDKFIFMTNYTRDMRDLKGAASEASHRTRELQDKQAELNDKATKKADDPKNAMTRK